MIKPQAIFAFVVLHAVVLASAPLLGADDLKFEPKDYDQTNGKTLKASIARAEREAHSFVANPQNKGAEAVAPDFFAKNVSKKYATSATEKLAPNTVGNAGPLVPGMIVASAMQQVERSEMDDGQLQSTWLKKLNEVLTEMTKGSTPIFDPASGNAKVWQQLLMEWLGEATRDGKSLRKALQEAPYALLSALTEDFAAQEAAAKAGSGGGNATQSSNSGASSGSYYPWHERRMNHIVHHHERRMARAERIRARR